jgi:hypothetical protein
VTKETIMRISILGFMLVVAACGGGDSEDDDGSTGGGGGNGTGEKCYDIPINDRNDGSSACGPNVCQGGTYCVSDVGICDPGCRSELECPRGEFCDLSNAGGDLIGLCRVPGAEHEVACGTTGKTCGERCAAKTAQCGAPADVGAQACGMLCPTISEEQIDCLETTSCEELEALMQGQTVCGITPPE